MPATYPPTLKVEIAFATDPLSSSPTWTDVTDYVRGFNSKRGRAHELSRPDAGAGEIILDNSDRRFDPTNTSSPYSPNVLPLRKVRVTLDDTVTQHRMFTGYVQRWPMSWEAPGYETDMEVSLIDGFEFLAHTNIATTLATLTTALTGTHNDLTFTAKGAGVAGNAISVAYHLGHVTTSHSHSPTIHFSTSETTTLLNFDGIHSTSYPPLTIIVPLDKTSGGAVLTTAEEIMAAVNSHAEASQQVVCTLATGNDGSGVVTTMARTLLSGGTYAQELSGTRIGNLLDDANWPAAERDLDAGQSQVQTAGFEAADDQVALQHAHDTSAAEGGYVFMAGNGNVTFHDRHHRALGATPLATFGDDGSELTYEALEPSYDRDEIRNDIRIEIPDSRAGTATDATSQSRYGLRKYQESLPLTTISEADDRADYLLYRYKDPHLRFERLVIQPLESSTLWPQVLTREIGDRITVKRRPSEHPTGGAVVISQDCFIEQVSLSMEAGPVSGLVCEWQLSPADLDLFWILGDSTYGVLDSTTRLGY